MVEKKCLKETRTIYFQGLNALKMKFKKKIGPNFEHVKFSINGKYSKQIMTIQTIKFPL